jgi:hypothetical protein
MGTSVGPGAHRARAELPKEFKDKAPQARFGFRCLRLLPLEADVKGRGLAGGWVLRNQGIAGSWTIVLSQQMT